MDDLLPSPSSSSATSTILAQTLSDVQIRCEVSSVLQNVLTDVELAHTLQAQLASHNADTRLRHDLAVVRSSLEETRAMQEVQHEKNVKVADGLVGELWALSVQLGELESWKSRNESKVLGYDEMLTKLGRAEESLRRVERKRGGNLGVGSDGDRDEFEEADEEGDILGKGAIVEGEGVKGEGAPVEPESDTAAAPASQKPTTAPAPAPAVNREITPPMPTRPPPEIGRFGSINYQEKPSLPDMDEETLMAIFGYLEAFDILSTAQVNISLYSKIDSLFGLGSGGGSEQDEGQSVPPPVVDEEDDAGKVEDVEDVKGESSGVPTKSAPPKSVTSEKTPASATVRADVSKPAPASASTAQQPATRKDAGGGLGTVFPLFQKRDGSTTPPRHRRAPSSEKPSQQQQQPPSVGLNAAVVNSMASKLTPAEMSAIISMTDRIRQKEREMDKLRQEREDLAASLEGTEAVKEFLINKVRDVERALKKSQEESVKVTQQIASDQEVIAFLDGRVQELERSVRELEEGKSTAVEDFRKYKNQNEKKVQVLGDMLQFEREQKVDSEREWKTTKKVLVKEVKSCRAQIVTLQAERDGYMEQNGRLREALLTVNSGGSGGGGGSVGGLRDER